MAFRSLKVATLSDEEGNQGPCLTVRHCCSGCQEYKSSVSNARRRDPGGARGDRRADGGGVPVMRGGVHVSEGPRVHLARATSPTAKTESSCGGTKPGGGAGRTTANAVLVHRGHRAGPGAGADHAGGCAPRSARRSGMRPARWPRSPKPTGCRGRPRTAPSSPTPRRCWPSRNRSRCSVSTRPGAASPAGNGAPTTRRWVRVDPWDTGFVDLAGDQGLLGQREGRTGAAVIDWLSERSDEFRAGVRFVAIDPAAVYASAVRTPGLLPNATLVVDHFHLVKLANDALTKVRRRVTWDLRDRRGRKIDPEWANRRRLLRARERLSDKSFTKMWNAIVSEDDTGQILSAWIAKEELRTLLSTVRVGGDPHLTRHRLHRFLAWCIDSQIPELLTLAATVDTWWPEINAFIATGITNARTEGYNRLVKQVKRVACGFRNPENSARRIRFHCTRKQRAATQTSC